MGGNGSYSTEFGGVIAANRTHFDTGYRIDGHKVVILQDNPSHDKIIMNSNSENPIYLFASIDDKTGKLTISSIGIYKKHMLTMSIDIMFDGDGNVIPYNEGEHGTHAHNWSEVSPGVIGRKSHDKSNHLPIPEKYKSLIEKIVEFNKKGKTWTKESVR